MNASVGEAWQYANRQREHTSKAEMPLPKKCPFCNVDSARLLRQSGLAIALTDAFPVSLGHALIVPRRHIQSWFESTDDERQEMFTLLDEIRAEILKAHSPPAFNIGINDGPAAGQTVPHLHIHLIPRYTGDSPDPRGGIRWVLPGQADYWNERG